MKAILYREYGSPDVLKYEDIDKPVPAEDEVLIKVRAASVNPLDAHLMKGVPGIVRALVGIKKQKINRPGVDVAGEVEALGNKVTAFRAGDAVFGSCKGAFAEYVCTSESKVVMKPQNVTFEQAASVPVAAYTALQGLRDKAQLQPGQKVLVNGAAGGVGTLTVQIAKSLGAETTGVCSTRNVEMVHSIGADHVIDYTREDFTRGGRKYEIIFDLVANHSVSACARVLSRKGTYIGAGVLGLSKIGVVGHFLTTPILACFMSQKFVTLLAKSKKEDLALIGDLMATGKVIPVIDRRYRLSEVPAAIRYLEEGHARGKVIVNLEHNE